MKEANILKANALFDWSRHRQDAIFALGQRKLFDARLVNSLVVVYARVEQHVGIPPTLLSSELHSFQIVIVNFSHVVTAKALSFQLLVFVHFAFRHFSVVKLVPLFASTLISETKGIYLGAERGQTSLLSYL